MCAIAGIYNLDGKPVEERALQKMAEVMKHRGPDDEDYYLDRNIGFAHRRLSIIDLSSAGHQPMSNGDKSIWIIHNGEIYNYLELREDLRKKGYRFKINIYKYWIKVLFTDGVCKRAFFTKINWQKRNRLY